MRSGSKRTKAERAVDSLTAEAKRLRGLQHPTPADRARLSEVTISLLPKAWRAVNAIREQERQRRLQRG